MTTEQSIRQPQDTRSASPPSARLLLYAWKSAYALIAATALAVGLGAGFFVYGGIFGPLSDAAGLLVGLLLVPLVWVTARLYSEHRLCGPVSVVGGLAVAGTVVGSLALLVGNLVGAEFGLVAGAFLGVQFLGWLLLGIWLLGLGVLGLQTESVARRVSWAALVAGVGAAGGMVTLVYSYAVGSFTPVFPVLMGAYAVGFLLWAFWLGGELRARVRTAPITEAPGV